VFDPSAKCPAWDRFIADVFPADSKAVAWEVPAWLMTPDTSIQKAVLLTGEGANGKSTYLRAVIAFIGKHNTAAVSLHRLEQDKFAIARLAGKLANICPDLPSTHLASTSMFKALTGGDVLHAEYKYLDSFEFIPFAKLVFSANQPPRSDDSTHGFFRRWLVVSFTRTFEEGATGTRSREELDAQLSDPAELSGLLNKALGALAAIRKRGGFTESESMKRSWSEFRTATDPLSVWLDRNTVELPNAQILQSELVAAFNQYTMDLGKPAMTKTAFGLALKHARPGVESCQRAHKDKQRQWVYIGIALRTPENSGG
jgi:putative DNA primase/helicase